MTADLGVTPTPLALLLLGRAGRPGQRARRRVPRRPAAGQSTPTWSSARGAAKAALGDRVFVLGHHYQRDEVIEFADVTGDSFKLAREAAARPERRTSCSAACTSWPRAPTS